MPGGSSSSTGAPLRSIRLRQPAAYRFNVMVVGESGLGKSTFLRTLFKGFVAENRPQLDIATVAPAG